MERTFIAVKPDGVQRGLVGEIIGRFERKGFKLVGMKMLTVSHDLAEKHYGEHKGKPFFGGLVEFITSGPVVAMAWEGPNIVAESRKMIGATKPSDSAPGTIRGDLAVDVGRNIIHGSSDATAAQGEVSLWFTDAELSSWEPSNSRWLIERRA